MLYIVSTPIGNLQDITLRALDTLKSADVIFAEDTRRTKTLLDHFLIDKPVYRYNENDDSSVKNLSNIAQNKNCALVCDGGTPCISDPGWKLVKECLAKEIKVVPLPGPSALTCALSGAGITGGAFTFLGFMPRKQGKIAKMINAAYALEKPVVIYESPYRIIKLLEIVIKELGPQTPVILARELTKIYEEWIRGTAAQAKENLEKRSKILGEFVFIIDRPAAPEKEEKKDDYPHI